jgi:glycosyltransferase involved in cell wall biosynthesis
LIDQGYRVIFLLDRVQGELLSQVPAGCEIKGLCGGRQIRALPKLVRYLKRTRPDLLIANMEHMNVMAVMARALAQAPTRIVATQHSTFSEQIKRRSWQFRALPLIYRLAMPFADAIVAVSRGVADDLASAAGLRRTAMTVIYNGVVADDFDTRAAREPEQQWFADGRPVVLGMGRLVAEKDFATLIRAFERVAQATDAKLVILGEGPLRASLEDQVKSLGELSNRIALPGFVANPLPLLRRARLFVLSSRAEGFGNVIAEALACGTPVVSTDCPFGPAEILDHGQFGTLVPVGNADALGRAILNGLRQEPDRAELVRRGRLFSVAKCASNYGRLMETCCSHIDSHDGRQRNVA